MPGKFSIYNSLTAIAVCRHFKVTIEDIKRALKEAKVKGRIEMVRVSDDFTLMIDYAHNAMSLESLLTTLKEYEPKRLVCLFGCGGNRSRLRRYEMGEVSGTLADLTVVTSDNPRFEEPQAIIDDIRNCRQRIIDTEFTGHIYLNLGIYRSFCRIGNSQAARFPDKLGIDSPKICFFRKSDCFQRTGMSFEHLFPVFIVYVDDSCPALEELNVIGITGTKGKTTTTYMVKSILEHAGYKTGLIGTIEAIIGDEVIPANNTTPESYIVQKYFRKMVDEGSYSPGVPIIFPNAPLPFLFSNMHIHFII